MNEHRISLDGTWDQPAPGGGTGDTRTGRLECAVQLGCMRIGRTDHRQYAGLPGGESRRDQRQQVRPSEALPAGTPKVGLLAQMASKVDWSGSIVTNLLNGNGA